MVDFSLEPEHTRVRDTIYRYAVERILPVQEKIQQKFDEEDEFAWPIWDKFKELGLLGFPFPKEYGGQGASSLSTTLVWEALGLARIDAGMTLSLSAHTILCGIPIATYGTEHQKRRYLTKLARGEMIGCFAISEPRSGSGLADLETVAEKKGDRWILNGLKSYVTNAPVADLFLVFAVTDRSRGSDGVTAFLVERGMKGLSVSENLKKMGNRLSPTSNVLLENCEVPDENVLGKVNEGLVQVAKLASVWERTVCLSHSVGLLEALIKELMSFANSKLSFGKPILRFQAVQKKIVDMRVTLEVARSYLYKIAWHIDRSEIPFVEASCFKIFWGDSIVNHLYDAIQIMGGFGYTRGARVEKEYRDGRLITIGGGTSEIQRLVLAKSILGISENEIE